MTSSLAAQAVLPLLPVEVGRLPHAVLQMLTQEGLPWQARGSAPVTRFLLWDSRRERPQPRPGQRLLDIGPLLDALPRDVLADRDSSRPTQWQLGNWTLCEQTARHDRRAVRRRFATRLRTLLEEAGGVWLAVSPYPALYRSWFGFRLDHDCYRADDFAAVLRAIRGQEHAVSHYVNADGYSQAADALWALRGWHVGSHGYWHHTYRSVKENLHNLRRGIEWLQQAGHVPVGCVAPHGRYHQGLAEALRQLGVDHSSEFALAWDELPFFPAGSPVLQVPVHPVCLGLALEAAARKGAGEEELQRAAEITAEHFVRLIHQRHQAGEPLILYGHPDGRLGRYPHVLRRALDSAAALTGCWMAHLAEISSWWRARQEVRLQVEGRPGGCLVRAVNLPERYAIGCVIRRGTAQARVVLRSSLTEVRWDELSFEPEARAQPQGLVVRGGPCRRSWRDRLRACLDWERVTPLGELRGGGICGWAKRTLRRIGA